MNRIPYSLIKWNWNYYETFVDDIEMSLLHSLWENWKKKKKKKKYFWRLKKKKDFW